MVDKPVPKKPIHPVEAVVKAGDLTAKLGEPIAQKTGDNWVIFVYSHPVAKSRFSYSLTHILHHRLVAKIEAEKAHDFVGWALPTSLY